MSKIIITIDTDNAAFDDEDEAPRILRRILKELSERIEISDFPTMLRDINGNYVGSVEYVED